MNTNRNLVILGKALVFIAFFMPWADLGFMQISGYKIVMNGNMPILGLLPLCAVAAILLALKPSTPTHRLLLNASSGIELLIFGYVIVSLGMDLVHSMDALFGAPKTQTIELMLDGTGKLLVEMVKHPGTFPGLVVMLIGIVVSAVGLSLFLRQKPAALPPVNTPTPPSVPEV